MDEELDFLVGEVPKPDFDFLLLDSICAVAITEEVLNDWDELKRLADIKVTGPMHAAQHLRVSVRASGIRLEDCWATKPRKASASVYVIDGQKLVDFVNR